MTVEHGTSKVKVEAPPKMGAVGLNWVMVEPVKAPADEQALTALLLTLGNLRAESWESDAVDDGKYFGLDEPWMRVKWTMEDAPESSKKRPAQETSRASCGLA